VINVLGVALVICALGCCGQPCQAAATGQRLLFVLRADGVVRSLADVFLQAVWVGNASNETCIEIILACPSLLAACRRQLGSGRLDVGLHCHRLSFLRERRVAINTHVSPLTNRPLSHGRCTVGGDILDGLFPPVNAGPSSLVTHAQSTSSKSASLEVLKGRFSSPLH